MRNVEFSVYEAMRRGKGGFVIHVPNTEGASLAPAAEGFGGFAAQANDNCLPALN